MMKKILACAAMLLLPLVQGGDAMAQMKQLIFDEDRTVAADGQGELRLDIENIDFLRDNEYVGGRTDGYTLPGFLLRPTLTYQPLANLKIEAGFNMTTYWGATAYQELYFRDPIRHLPTGESKRVNMTPFLRVHAKLSPAVDLVIVPRQAYSCWSGHPISTLTHGSIGRVSSSATTTTRRRSLSGRQPK